MLRLTKQHVHQHIPAGHSLLFGHIPLLLRLRKGLPNDASDMYANRRLVLEWRKTFPRAEFCPPVIYLDIWPLMDEAIAIINEVDLIQGVVQHRDPPRHAMAKYLQSFVSGYRNLSAWDGNTHKLWRSRMNPGFSPRNLQSFMPELVHEVSIFTSRLRKACGTSKGKGRGEWGAVFPLLPLAIDLTFDVICKIVLDITPGEQTNGPTVFQESFTILSRHQIVKSIRNLPTRLDPWWHLERWRCHRALRSLLLPHIQRLFLDKDQVSGSKQKSKTVIRLAVQEVKDEPQNQQQTTSLGQAEIEEDILGLTKQFIMAGRVTTAITLCFAFHNTYSRPDVLAKIRAEHDQVLGANPQDAGSLLIKSPHLLQSLPYTLAVIKETLRLHPLASNIRQGSAEVVLKHEGCSYPTEGCILMPAIETIHYQPEIWPRVTEFLPERWVVPEGHELYPLTKHAWRPFEQGPMACIGLELALMELKLAFVFMVRELDIECAWDEWDSLR